MMYHQSTSIDHRRLRSVVMFILTLVVPPSVAWAQGVRGAMGDLVRGTARVADDVPVNKVDELVAELGKSRAAREAVDTELRKAGRLTETGDVVRRAARADEVLRLLRSAAPDLDPSVVRRLEGLDDASRDVALLLARGGDELARIVPDLATRGRLVREGGPATVAAVGMFGPDAARATLRLDEAIRGGMVIVKDGGRAVTVADFGAAMILFGDASWKFWKGYIQPHWKLWAASGALAAYLTNPEYFQNAAGKLAEAGFEHLTEFVGEISASVIRGVGGGSEKAIEKIADATRDTFFNSKNGVYSTIGAIAFVACVSLFFRRVRNWVLWPLRWLNQSPGDAKSSNSNT